MALQAEQFISTLPAKCSHNGEGCLFQTTGGNATLKSHEADCVFKRVPCPHTDCEEKMSLALLESHVNRYHQAPKLDRLSDGFVVHWPAHIKYGIDQISQEIESSF
jgi:hypothetical protein